MNLLWLASRHTCCHCQELSCDLLCCALAAMHNRMCWAEPEHSPGPAPLYYLCEACIIAFLALKFYLYGTCRAIRLLYLHMPQVWWLCATAVWALGGQRATMPQYYECHIADYGVQCGAQKP